MIRIHPHTVFVFLLLSCMPVYGLEIGDPAPSCEATMLGTGDPFDPGAYRGKVIYLDFWATWCPPCRKSMPFMVSLHKELGGQGLEVVALSVDETADAINQFLARYPVGFSIAHDPKGDCPQKFEVMAMPSSYLIDRQGRIRYVHLGFRDGDKAELREKVVELLGEAR